MWNMNFVNNTMIYMWNEIFLKIRITLREKRGKKRDRAPTLQIEARSWSEGGFCVESNSGFSSTLG